VSINYLQQKPLIDLKPIDNQGFVNYSEEIKELKDQIEDLRA